MSSNRDSLGRFVKGFNYSPSTQFKKGLTPWNKENGIYGPNKIKHSKGYVVARTPKGLVLEHRFVMEKKIGRRLRPDERVHHINGKRDDNRPENLELFPNHSCHMSKCHHRNRNDLGQFI